MSLSIAPRMLAACCLMFLALAGCAQLPAGAPAEPVAAPVPPAAKAPAPAPRPPREEPLPKQELTPQILYEVLLAEIAAQRGHLDLAVRAYLDLAQSTRDPRLARRAAELAVFDRDMASALQAARLWVDVDPDSLQARQTLAGLLVAANRIEEVVPHVAHLLAQEGENLGEALLRLNRLFARQTDKKLVVRLVDQLTEPYVNLPEAHFAREQAAANAEDYARALEETDKALALRPDWEQAVLLKAQVQRRSDPPAALETLRRYIGKYPGASDVRLAYARALVSERQYEQARGEFRKLMKDFPDNADVAYAVAVLSLQLKDYATAEDILRKLLGAGYPEANNARLYLGQIAEERKHYDEALSWYSQVTSGEQYFAAQVRYASVLARQGRLDDARKHLRQAASATPADKVQYLLAEAQLMRDNGKAQEAFDYLQAQLAAQPEQPELLYETAMLAEKLDRMDLVESYLRTLIQVKPDYAHAYNALGYSLAERGQKLDEAQQLIAKALELSPDDPFILDSMGWVLYRKGDNPGALGYLQKAFETRADPEIAAHLGEVLWAMGRRSDAQRVWRDAAKANPDNDALNKTIKRFSP